MITCPHCAGLNVAGCCLCQGSRRVEDDPRASAWLWHYAGCDCDACVKLAGAVGPHVTPPERPNLLEPPTLTEIRTVKRLYIRKLRAQRKMAS